MSTFILRILFSGLMAFIPDENGTEVTVLLLNAEHYHTSDGAAMQPHKPLLIARAGNCAGDCVDDDIDVAEFLWRDKSSAVALDSLAYAVGNGSVWPISGSDIAIRKVGSNAADLPPFSLRTGVRGTINGEPQIIPTTSTERQDISWIARLSQVCGSGCTLDPHLFDTVPPAIVAARFKINAGTLFTSSIARIGSNVTPVHFRRLDGTGSASSYSQAVATWVGAEIQVTGNSVEFVETKHSGAAGRSMILSPDSTGTLEVAVINLPPFIPPASTSNEAPQVGKHWELYYGLLTDPPAREARLVPVAGALSGASVPQVSWSDIHPSTSVYSELLNRIRLDVGRSVYDRTICPPTYWP